jgi:quercetin dioxygenase-like cupin family protein
MHAPAQRRGPKQGSAAVFLHPAVDIATLPPVIATLAGQPAGQPAPGVEWLAALAAALAVTTGRWRDLDGWPGVVAPRPGDRGEPGRGEPAGGWADGWADGDGTCLLRTEAVEVRLVRWAAGQGTRGHDHGGARSALAVVEGELVEDRFEPPLWQASPRRGRLHAGAVATLPADHAHVLANPGPRAAASIHVVSPPSLPARARSIGAASILAELLPRT